MKLVDINGNIRECQTAAVNPKYPGFVEVVYISRRTGQPMDPQWYPVSDFLKNNPKLHEIVDNSKPNIEELVGQVTSAGPDFLRDNAKNVAEDAYVGYPIWISRGKGEGQTRKIITNSKNTFTVDDDWEIKPDTTSQYCITPNLPKTGVYNNSLGVQPKTN